MCNGREWLLSNREFGVAPWCYIINRFFWVKHKFTFVDNIRYEDSECMPRVMYYAHNTCSLATFSVYNYIQNKYSFMHSKISTRHCDSIVKIIQLRHEFIAKISDDIDAVAHFERECNSFYLSLLNHLASANVSNKDIKSYMNQLPSGFLPKLKYSNSLANKILLILSILPTLYVTIKKFTK